MDATLYTGLAAKQEIYFDADASTRLKMSMGNAAPASHNHDANNITSGTLAVARGGTGADGSSVTKNYVLAAPSAANGAVAYRALVSDDIPNLAAEKITSGTFDAARIPNLSTDKLTSGTLGVARGGTGGTTAETARTSLGAAAKTTKTVMSLSSSNWTLNSTSGFYEYNLTGSFASASYDLEIDLNWDTATEDQVSDWGSCQIVGSYNANKLVARGGQPSQNYPVIIYATALI